MKPVWPALSESRSIETQTFTKESFGSSPVSTLYGLCLTCMKRGFHSPAFFFTTSHRPFQNRVIHLKIGQNTRKQTNPSVLDMTGNQNSLLEAGLICSLIPVLLKKDRWERLDKWERPLKRVWADRVRRIYTHPACPSSTSSTPSTSCHQLSH